jgi:ferredoxin-NADP reductase
VQVQPKVVAADGYETTASDAGPRRCLLLSGGVGRLPVMALTERDRAILEFERAWWTRSERKVVAIRERLGLSPSRYYQLLGVLAASDEAMAHDPLLVRRLRRTREQRRRARFGGRPAEQRPSR